MSQADRIIHLLGGVRRAAEIVGAPLTTVQYWRDGGFIPARRQAGVIIAARRAGISITPDHFFDLASDLPRDVPPPSAGRAA